MFSSNEFQQIKLSEGGSAVAVDIKTNEYRYNVLTRFEEIKEGIELAA